MSDDGLKRGRDALGRFLPGKRVTGGSRKGRPNRATTEARELAQRLVTDQRYLRKLKKRLVAGDLPGTVEAMLWYFAFGRPTERVAIESSLHTIDFHQLRALRSNYHRNATEERAEADELADDDEGSVH